MLSSEVYLIRTVIILTLKLRFTETVVPCEVHQYMASISTELPKGGGRWEEGGGGGGGGGGGKNERRVASPENLYIHLKSLLCIFRMWVP